MRLNWMVPQGTYLSIGDIHSACREFYLRNKVVPDLVKMSFVDMSNFLSMMPNQIQTLERGKDYGIFLVVPGGMIELVALEHTDESIAGAVNSSPMSGTMIVIESTRVDREFEKHVLNKDT